MRTKVQHLLVKRWLSLATLLLLLPLLMSTASIPSDIPSLTLNQRQLCDLELLMNGGFAPLKTFLNRQDYDRVVNEMRLSDGTLWPIPVVLDIQKKNLETIQKGKTISLKDQEGYVLALLEVDEIWQPNKELEAEKVYGTTDTAQPGVHYLLNRVGEYYISGKLTKLQPQRHFDFVDLRKTPDELKNYFKENGIEKVIAFQTRSPMHRPHFELTMRAAIDADAHLLIHPIIGMTKPGDIDYFTRVKCYKKILDYYPEGTTTLNLLPLAMRMAGPREALWNAIIQKNYGCTHFIMRRNHKGLDKDNAKRFYPSNAAQELVQTYAKEIGIVVISFKKIAYVEEDNQYQYVDEMSSDKKGLTLSSTQFIKLLNEGEDIPEWYSFSEVIQELRKVYPPRSKQGFTLFFTGLSGSGKSTIANAVAAKLLELQDRPITMLDGDVIRHHLSSELGFSKEHRSINVRRVGFVSSEITKNRGIAICPMIAPYEIDRKYNRELVSTVGNFIEIYVSTPVDVCADRDTKGLYELAKQGKITGFTGVNDPYEAPLNPEIAIDTSAYSLEEAVEIILSYLRQVKHIN